MPKFSQRSIKRLDGVHPDIITVLHNVIKVVDFTVLYGVRTAQEQFSLFKRGRKEVAGAWVIADKKKVVTYKDGYLKKSTHQSGNAVDIVFYKKRPPHIEWNNDRNNFYLIGMVLGTADMLHRYGAIDSDLISGGNWDDDAELDDQTFFDAFHFQIKR